MDGRKNRKSFHRGTKRTKHQILADRTWVVAQRIRGMTLLQIGTEFVGLKRPYTLSRNQLGNDWEAVAAEWREARLDSADIIIKQELAGLYLLENELWRAWDDSKKQGLPDASYSAGILAVKAQRQKLLGLCPEKVELSGPQGKPMTLHSIVETTEITPEELRDTLREAEAICEIRAQEKAAQKVEVAG